MWKTMEFQTIILLFSGDSLDVRAMKYANSVKSAFLRCSKSFALDVRESHVVLNDDLITSPVQFTTSEDELVGAQRMGSNVLNPSH